MLCDKSCYRGQPGVTERALSPLLSIQGRLSGGGDFQAEENRRTWMAIVVVREMSWVTWLGIFVCYSKELRIVFQVLMRIKNSLLNNCQ